mgnify:CR=1 FL=1
MLITCTGDFLQSLELGYKMFAYKGTHIVKMPENKPQVVQVYEDSGYEFAEEVPADTANALSTEISEEPMVVLKTMRNAELQISDWTQSTDSPLSESDKVLWATYRQLLRDLPSTAIPSLTEDKLLTDVKWPPRPS